MKTVTFLSLASAAAAFVIPDTQVFSTLDTRPREQFTAESVIEDVRSAFHRTGDELDHALHRFAKDVHHKYEDVVDEARTSLDDAFTYVEESSARASDKFHEHYFAAQEWLESAKETWDEEADYSTLGHGHHGDHDDHGHHGGHHGKPHHKSNKTVYELIATSKYTSKLAELINDYDDLVELLNGTTANFTVFAPTNRAFEKIPEHAPKPSKEFLKALLTYHVSGDFYPAGRVLVTKTIPTLLNSSRLGKEPQPQRLSTNVGFKGLTVNFYSRVVAIDIFGTNGVIHGVDSLLLPPPPVRKIIEALPSEFSTLDLGFIKTGLYEGLNSTKHTGGTLFAPSNFAFAKLGPRINAFLFSSHGLKYLKALLEYHVVPKITLYSDAIYGTSKTDSFEGAGIPKGQFHIDLPTLLKNHSLAIDIGRYGRLIEIKINSFARVAIPDGVAYDGVVHVLSNVLIPPRKLSDDSVDVHEGGEMSVDEFKARLEPFLETTYVQDL